MATAVEFGTVEYFTAFLGARVKTLDDLIRGADDMHAMVLVEAATDTAKTDSDAVAWVRNVIAAQKIVTAAVRAADR